MHMDPFARPNMAHMASVEVCWYITTIHRSQATSLTLIIHEIT